MTKKNRSEGPDKPRISGPEVRACFLIVVLSTNSIQSPWVEEEVEAALEKERKENKFVLFPIRLDDAVMDTQQAWTATLRRTRHIGDFRNWKDHDAYKGAFDGLLRDLKVEKTVASARPVSPEGLQAVFRLRPDQSIE